MEEIASHLIPENKWDLENGIVVYLIALRVSLPKKLILNEFCVCKWCLLTVSGSDFFSSLEYALWDLGKKEVMFFWVFLMRPLSSRNWTEIFVPRALGLGILNVVCKTAI